MSHTVTLRDELSGLSPSPLGGTPGAVSAVGLRGGAGGSWPLAGDGPGPGTARLIDDSNFKFQQNSKLASQRLSAGSHPALHAC
eukprot:99397-Prorocentrum_minimum.AAC.1